MTSQSTTQRTELAQRTSNGIEVTLVWVHGDGDDKVVVSAHDSRDGSSFEIPAERHLALDVYYHPFAYRDFGTVVDDDGRLAGTAR
jgi:hypothetical protein